MSSDEENGVNECSPIDLRYRTLLQNDQVQNFLQRHGLTTYGGKPLRKKDMEKRLQQMDEQSMVDVVAQSVIEKALDIKRPLKKSDKRTSSRNSKEIIEDNPYVSIYDNSCAITMIYCGMKPLRNDTLRSFKIQGDEVIVMQYQTNSNAIVVYKSFLRPNDEFTYKSHRILDAPFTIAIYINGIIDSRISTCCERGYLKQRNLQAKRSLFQVLFVLGGTPCHTCQANELMDSSVFDNELAQSEWISIVNSDQIAPPSTFRTHMSYPFEPFIGTDASKKSRRDSESKTTPMSFTPIDLELLPDIIEKQLTTIDSSMAKSNEIQTSLLLDEMIENEQEPKIKDELINPMDEVIKHTHVTIMKHKRKDSEQLKITNEEGEEEQKGLISPIAKYEMQQLLSKYLLLLLPTSKSQIKQELTNDDQQLGLKSSVSDRVENLILIWLDMTTNKSEDILKCQSKLRSIINSLFIFRSIDETIHFMKNNKKEKIFLIISGSAGSTLIEQNSINEFLQLNSIYLYTHDKPKHKTSMPRNSKFHGTFTNIDSLCTRLTEDVKQCLNDLLPISILSQLSHKTKSINEEKQAQFFCAQLHRELLLTIEYSNNARIDFVEFCMNIYHDNQTERVFIEEFKNEYHSSKAIWWYTRSTFLTTLLNTALIRQDISMLYKLQFFIKDLHIQLEQLHRLYKPSLESRTFIVYRGLTMSKKLFEETFQQHGHDLLGFDTFLLTNLHKDIALQYTQNKVNDTDQSILFQIEINTDKCQYPFADISYVNSNETKDEILFSLGTVFRIDHMVKETTENEIWIISLTPMDEKEQQLKQIQITLLNFFKRVHQVQIERNDSHQLLPSYIHMANIHYKQNEYHQSLELYQKALESLLKLSSSDPLTIARYQSYIGMVYAVLEQDDEALTFYEKVLKIRKKSCQTNDLLLIDTFHTIADVYQRKNQLNKALKYYSNSLKMQSIPSTSQAKPNPLLIATTHINLAHVYYQENKINEALDHFLKAFDYQQEHGSEYHPILAFLCNDIATTFYRLKQFDLALKYYLLTLKIEDYSLPKDHKTLSITYTHIATCYEQIKDYDQAIHYAEKAVHQLKSHRSKTKQAYLDQLIKDKQLFQKK